MDMIYNSANYCVVEFKAILAEDSQVAQVAPSQEDSSAFSGGYEIVDKFLRKEIFINGTLAVRFREQVQKIIDKQPSTEEIDDFLSAFSWGMQQPVILH